MKYRDILGYNKKKSPSKKQSKPKKNSVVENLKKELNEWTDTTFKNKPKRWSAAGDTGLTEHEKQLQEGPAYEYRKHLKNIEKSRDTFGKDVLNFYELLRKKGLNDEAYDLLDNYKKNVIKFGKEFKKFTRKLM